MRATFKAALYKGTRPGMAGVYNRLVRWWTRSIYSHAELVFAGGWCGSASFMDHGVRLKVIDFNPEHWDFIDLPAALEPAALDWFKQHRGAKYDIWGNLHFVISPVVHDTRRWFCSEAIAAALGLPDPWRYDPGVLASALTAFQTPPSSGFLRAADEPTFQ